MKNLTSKILVVLLGMIASDAAMAAIASKEYVDGIDTAIRTDVTNTLVDYASTTTVNQIVNDAIDDAVAGIGDNITDMATKTWVGDQGYATTDQLNTGLAAKANQTTTYTKTEVDAAIAAIPNPDLSGYETTVSVDGKLANKADTASLGNLATKSAISTTDINNGNVTKIKLEESVRTSLDRADTALQSADIAGKENISNKVTTIGATSTDSQYPSAKAVNDALAEKVGGTELREVVTNLEETISLKADVVDLNTLSSSVNAQMATKADKATTYTKTEVDNAIAAIPATDVSGKEDVSNKVTEITDVSTAVQYPSAKAVYDYTEALNDNLNSKINDLGERVDAVVSEKEDLSNKSNDLVADATSNTKYPTVSAVVTRMDEDYTDIRNRLDDVIEAIPSVADMNAKENVSNKSSDINIDRDSATKYPTTQAVVSYIRDVKDTIVSELDNAKADKATTYTKTEVDAAIGTKVNTADLGSLALAAPGACSNAANKCVLTFDGTTYAWEVIER